MKKRHFQTVAVWTLVALATACGGKEKEDKATQVKEELPRVQVASVSARLVDQTEEYTATVESDVKNNISSNSNLRIEKIYVEVGDRVAKGQTLVQLDASNLRQLALQIENQKVEFGRINQLYRVGGVSKSEWDAAKMQLDVNRTQYNNMVVNTKLKSPVSGIVTARNYDNGDMAGVNPILVIEQISPVKVMINVSETYYPQVKRGMKVNVKLDTYGDEQFTGSVSIVYPSINANTHTFPVEITMANANQRVRPGMFARVTMTYGTSDHLVVPDRAIVKQAGAGDHYVYVYNPQTKKVSYNKVQIGRRLDDEYELISGVPDNSQVVVSGQKKLSNGAKVEVVK